MTENEPKTAEIVPMPPRPQPAPQAMVIPTRSWSLMPTSLGEAKQIAEMIAMSDFAPRDYKGKPNNVMIAIQMGADVGLKPMQALQNIAVINGRPCIWGDAALGLVHAGGLIERFVEKFDGEGDRLTAVCIVKRRGLPDEFRREFSVADAKLAGLWGKQGPWQTYPKRMLQMRARGFALRDAAPDLLLGLVLAEEAEDYPNAIPGTVVDSGPVVQPWQANWDALPEYLLASLEKGFLTLDETGGFSPAQRQMKLNEFLGGESELGAEDRGKILLEWLKDEYALRKFGKKRAPKPENGKPAPPETAARPAPVPTPAPGSGDQGTPSGAEGAVSPDTSGAPDRSAAASPFDQNKPGKGELFRWVV